MFNRAEYKKNALATLKGDWGLACVLTIISAILVPLPLVLCPVAGVCILGILGVAISFTFMKMSAVFAGSNPDEKVTFSTFLQGIEERWLTALLGALWSFLWISLWTLLFVVPGIVKSYSYSMMFFVIAENPKIGAMKAMDISKILTQGHKADLFVLDMSFLGWAFLSSLVSGLGFIWLCPYENMTKLQAYYDLKKMAFAQNKLTPADFEA